MNARSVTTESMAPTARCRSRCRARRSSRHDASSHPITLAIRSVSTADNQNTVSRFPKPPEGASRARAFTPHWHPSQPEASSLDPLASEGAPLPRVPHPCGASTADAVSRCVSRPPTLGLPRRLQLPEAVTVGRPVVALEGSTPAGEPAGCVPRAEALASRTPGVARSPQRSHPAPRSTPCGTVKSGTCLTLPLDNLGASPDRDALELSMPLDIPAPLDAAARPPSSREPPSLKALRPACSKDPFRGKDLHACVR